MEWYQGKSSLVKQPRCGVHGTGKMDKSLVFSYEDHLLGRGKVERLWDYAEGRKWESMRCCEDEEMGAHPWATLEDLLESELFKYFDHSSLAQLVKANLVLLLSHVLSWDFLCMCEAAMPASLAHGPNMGVSQVPVSWQQGLGITHLLCGTSADTDVFKTTPALILQSPCLT